MFKEDLKTELVVSVSVGGGSNEGKVIVMKNEKGPLMWSLFVCMINKWMRIKRYFGVCCYCGSRVSGGRTSGEQVSPAVYF